MLKYPDYILYGKPVTIMHKGYYKQKKTSRYGVLNFIYRILYGKEFIFEIDTGKIIECGNQLMMNPVTYNNLKEILEKEYETGLERPVIGMNHHSSKLDDKLVRYIRQSNKSNYRLAKELGVDPSTIRDARNKKTWRHII